MGNFDTPTGEDGSFRRLSVFFYHDDWNQLREWAERDGTTVQELVRRSIRLLRALEEEQLAGTTIMLRGKGKVISERLAPLNEQRSWDVWENNTSELWLKQIDPKYLVDPDDPAMHSGIM